MSISFWTWLRLVLATSLAVGCGFSLDPRRVTAAQDDSVRLPRTADTMSARIEAAMYARAEFLGAQALVPYPTAAARQRLIELTAQHADEPELYRQLAQLDEQLGRVAEAKQEMRRYVELRPNDPAALRVWADFLHRRAAFAEEAAVRESLLWRSPAAERAALMRELIALAQTHELEKYRQADFYREVIEADAGAAFEIVGQFVEKLRAEKSHAAALAAVRQYQSRFPARLAYFIEQETALLVELKQLAAAEQVYLAAFDPLWPEELAEQFYQFLAAHDRYRAYGHELREAFHREPANFDIALRLLHYDARGYGTSELPRIVAKLEGARATGGITWQPEELATLARFTLARGHGDIAARLLYTLHARGELAPGSPVRAKILYQLFELLSDAGDERLALTRGDLKFYEDVATSDPHPGLLGGVLSLVFSDAAPRRELRREEAAAVAHFNRAAAQRIFQKYKVEYPTAPELAQMYLDLVRLQTANGRADEAAAVLGEFETRHADEKTVTDYPSVALKLADAYSALNRHEDERRIYRRLLDHLGARRAASPAPLVPTTPDPQFLETTPVPRPYPFKSNQGIRIPHETDADGGGYSSTPYRDHLGTGGMSRRDVPAVGTNDEVAGDVGITYAEVFERYVASLAHDEKADEILELYAGELRKYPDEPGLYEQMLQWLGQAKLVDEQLRVYQAALRRFPTVAWRDRLARWYLRHERRREFADYSRQLLAQLGDEEAASYLAKFVGEQAPPDFASFDAQLYLGLYRLAHERFPRNLAFINGLLKFYHRHGRWTEWRALLAEHYFVSPEIREQLLSHLASRRELRAYLEMAREKCRVNGDAAENISGWSLLPYRLFRADAAAWLSNYEEAVDAYRELNRLYPATPQYAGRLIAFTRSLGQSNRKFLEEAGAASREMAETFPGSADYRTQAGEIQAELGDYQSARGEWEQLLTQGTGEPETYLNAATIYWDYFQYDDALRIIELLRERQQDESLYAFQAGVLLETKRQTPEALFEYVKALGAIDNPYDGVVTDAGRARRRLQTLARRPGGIPPLLAAFARVRNSQAGASGSGGGQLTARKPIDDAALVINIAGVFKEIGDWPRAAWLLRAETHRSRSREFLEAARDAFSAGEDTEGERLALRRLSDVAGNSRFAISYQLQLVESYQVKGQPDEAARVLDQLVRRFSSNYGVLSEAANIYWRLGRRADSLRTLRDGMTRGRGRFRYAFARKLAARELDAGRMDAAAAVLNQLHAENPLDLNVFHELAGVLVRSAKPAALRAAYEATLAAVAEHESDHKERREQIAALREQMIRAFTRLRDYEAAIDQHIEIINRNSEDEAPLEAALRYAERHGGGERLLVYYQRTAGQSYKNFRWHLVLARIHEARDDLAAAVVSYRHALAEQPEMIELYAALAAVHTRQKNYGAAFDVLVKACELSNDDPQYLKLLIAALEQSNRHTEAIEWRKRLPAPIATPERRSLAEQFAQAAQLGHATEQAQAVAAYRRAFDQLAAAPLKHELKASEIAGYVRTVREEESLAHIAARLFALRDQLLVETAQPDALRSGKARARLQTLDGALPESIGALAAELATGDELSALLRLIEERLAPLLPRDDQHGTLPLLQNLSRRAGFGHIEEQIMLARLASARAAQDELTHHTQLRSLVNLHADAGNYRQVVALLETEQRRDPFARGFGYAQLIAEYARLDGDQAKELQALRNHFAETSIIVSHGNQTAATTTTGDPLIERFFDALVASGEAGRKELRELSSRPGAHHFQLINYLIKRDERELAHAAITSAPQSVVWRLARNAEVALALGEREREIETYFVAALGFRSIGEMIARTPDTAQQLVGDDWFHLAGKYGQWLHADETNPGRRRQSRALLPAMLENRPRDAGEQARLGRWYLERHDHQLAAVHLQLALAAQPGDLTLKVDLGAAYFALGERQQATQIWRGIIARDGGHNGGDEAQPPTLAECQLYLETLSRHGLAATARARVTPLIIAALKHQNAGPENSFSREDETESHVASTLRALAHSFRPPAQQPARSAGDVPIAALSTTVVDDAAQARLFRELCEAVPEGTWLPEALLRESLVAPAQLNYFYRLLINRSDGSSDYDNDHEYAAQLASRWDEAEAEAALDHEKNFALELQEPASERFKWQREYLRHLLARGEDAAAQELIAEIERALKRRYARPVWLRLARLRLEVRSGRVASALANLRRLAGIDAHPNLTSISAPDASRVAAAVAMLRDERRAREADEFLAAADARQLALEQFDAPAFAGFARLAFARGDTRRGLQVLGQLIALSRDETRPLAEAELSAEPWIQAHAINDAAIETPAPRAELTLGNSLRVAAEVAAEYAQWKAAVEYRQQLFDFAPEDETNRIELVRALAFAGGRADEVVASLAAIIGDRRATRFARWQALWVAPEILGARPELWAALATRVRQANAGDVEMQRALIALAHHAQGRFDDALAEVRQGEPAMPATAQFAFLVATLEVRRGHDAATTAAQSLSRALINGGATDEIIWQFFAFSEDEPRAQLLRLYATLKRPRAALELAGKLALSPVSTDDPPPPNWERTNETTATAPSDAADERATKAGLGDSPETVSDGSTRPAQQSLEQRAGRRRQATRAELLGLLAACAEEVGELERAIGFERARLALATEATTRRTIEARLQNLLARQNERRRQQPPALKIDGRLVAAR